MEWFKGFSNTKPFYCHYLAIRLGTWRDESLFQFFDCLIQHGKSLPGWKGKGSQVASLDYGEFFGLIWELQVARSLSGLQGVSQVEWFDNNGGPDLKVTTGKAGEFYVECTTYRKSFALALFIEDMLRLIDEHLTIDHIPCITFKLPNDLGKQECLLNQIFDPLLDDQYLNRIRQEANQAYPVHTYRNETINLYIELEGNGVYSPDRVNASGRPEDYLRISINESIANKAGSRQLGRAGNMPNLLAVNYLLSADFQMAISRQRDLGQDIPWPDQSNMQNIDALALFACGIDQLPIFTKQTPIKFFSDNHPMNHLLD